VLVSAAAAAGQAQSTIQSRNSDEIHDPGPVQRC
jgi:hypothetical protein